MTIDREKCPQLLAIVLAVIFGITLRFVTSKNLDGFTELAHYSTSPDGRFYMSLFGFRAENIIPISSRIMGFIGMIVTWSYYRRPMKWLHYHICYWFGVALLVLALFATIDLMNSEILPGHLSIYTFGPRPLTILMTVISGLLITHGAIAFELNYKNIEQARAANSLHATRSTLG
jgi:hypothetical protein